MWENEFKLGNRDESGDGLDSIENLVRPGRNQSKEAKQNEIIMETHVDKTYSKAKSRATKSKMKQQKTQVLL